MQIVQLTNLSRNQIHALLGLGWTFAATYSSLHILGDMSANPDLLAWVGRFARVFGVSLLGAFIILGSWMLTDAAVHGKQVWFAVFYLTGSVLTCGLAIFPYLYATRSGKDKSRAVLQFLAVYLLGYVAMYTAIWLEVNLATSQL